jgi:hypothetical protein
MPNTVRTQPIWLPTGNPDTTNISSADFNSLGGQPGSLGQKFDYNDRVYQRVQLDSGAVAANPTGIPAVNQLLFWKDKDQYIVTNDRRTALGGSLGTSAYANFVAGVLRNAATAGNYIDIAKKADSIPLLDGGNTFAAGEMVFAEADSVAAADRVAVGTAVTFQRVGIARGAASGGLVSVDVDIDIEHQ